MSEGYLRLQPKENISIPKTQLNHIYRKQGPPTTKGGLHCKKNNNCCWL